MIHVGLVGAGFMGRNHFNEYEKLADRARVVALCDQDAERCAGDWSNVGGNIGDQVGTKRDLGDITPYGDFEKLLADARVDLVDICCPTYLHKDMTLAALKAGKHVLCEKPMALSVEDADAMVAAAAAAPGQLMVAQCIRFWPEYVYLFEAVRDGRFGRCLALELRRQAETPTHALNNWLGNPELSGGALLDLHIHDVDYAQHLFGRPAAVTALGTSHAGHGIDRVHAFWHYPDGPAVQLMGYWDMPSGFGFNMGFTASFEAGAVVWDLADDKLLTVYRNGAEPDQPEMPVGDTGFFGEIDYFLGCIEGNAAPDRCPPSESRDAVALALAEQRSIEALKTVPVDLD